MGTASLFLTSLIFGLVGSLSPCILGINAVFLGYAAGKPRAQRLAEWLFFALARSAFLSALGLGFGLLGQTVASFVRGYQRFIAWGLIALGVVLILSRFRRLPLPSLNLIDVPPNPSSALTLGGLFGLNIPSCTSSLVFALLTETALVGDWLAGALTLFVFGVGMSLPLLAVTAVEGANRLLVAAARRWRTPFYVLTGGLLILLGTAELSPRVMAVVGGWFKIVAAPFLSVM